MGLNSAFRTLRIALTAQSLLRDSYSNEVIMPGLSFLNKKGFHTTNVKV